MIPLLLIAFLPAAWGGLVTVNLGEHRIQPHRADLRVRLKVVAKVEPLEVPTPPRICGLGVTGEPRRWKQADFDVTLAAREVPAEMKGDHVFSFPSRAASAAVRVE